MTRKKPSIVLQNVSKEYYFQSQKTIKELLPSLIGFNNKLVQHDVLHDISLNISMGESVGVVGKNGAGKSTLMKLIAGVTYPTSGSISVNGRVAPLIELGAGFHHEMSGYENLYLNAAILGMHKAEIQAVESEIIAFSGIEQFMNEPLKHFSTGMVMRLAFSIAVHTSADILLIDEVLAVGDAEFQEKCIERLKKIKATGDSIIVFISHDELSVRNFCERAILIDSGSIQVDGTPDTVFAQYHKQYYV